MLVWLLSSALVLTCKVILTISGCCFIRITINLADVFTALFTNMGILKFKSQLMIAFFAAVNHLNGPLRKQNFTLTGSKGQGL